MDDRMRTVGDVTRGGCRGVGSQQLQCLHLGSARCAWTLWILGLVFWYAEYPTDDGGGHDTACGERRSLTGARLCFHADVRQSGTSNVTSADWASMMIVTISLIPNH